MWQTFAKLSGSLWGGCTDLESRQDAVQTSTSFILWTPVECQGAESRSKENCSSEKDESTGRCGDNEEFPRSCELSQQV